MTDSIEEVINKHSYEEASVYIAEIDNVVLLEMLQRQILVQLEQLENNS